ncbi:MAG: glutathione S-transferase [Pseudohongiellaceae bacterium]|jgi:glutathione S-transferase
MIRVFDITTSTLASTLRSWRGTTASKTAKQPEQDLILFEREGCSECRFVREALTELDLNAMIAPCPFGGKNIRKLKRESGSDQLPYLVDPNTEKKITGRQEIITYLFKEYRDKKIPKQLENNRFNNTSSKLASFVRLNAGINSVRAHSAKLPMTLYSFESSPFSRPVREKLCELELPYLLVNLGKQQRADMGQANFRFTLKPYQPIPNTKRDAFFKLHGNVQVPFLVDPNTGTELFESKDIVTYLNQTYLIK